MDLGHDVVHLLLRLGHHLAGLAAELIGTAHRRLERGRQRCTHFRHILRRQHRGDADHHAGQQGDLEQRDTGCHHSDRCRHRHRFIDGGVRLVDLAGGRRLVRVMVRVGGVAVVFATWHKLLRSSAWTQKTSVMQGLPDIAALGNRVAAVHDSAATNGALQPTDRRRRRPFLRNTANRIFLQKSGPVSLTV